MAIEFDLVSSLENERILRSFVKIFFFQIRYGVDHWTTFPQDPNRRQNIALDVGIRQTVVEDLHPISLTNSYNNS